MHQRNGRVKGYVNRADLTKEKFIKNPFKPGETLYRTGDLARWLPDGTIEYVGRIDDQVKIRGHRIELEEIEKQLQEYPGVKDAVVVADRPESGDASINAYLVNRTQLSAEDVKAHLKNSFLLTWCRKPLPSWMSFL